MKIVREFTTAVRVSDELMYNSTRAFGSSVHYIFNKRDSAAEIIKQIPRRAKRSTQ